MQPKNAEYAVKRTVFFWLINVITNIFARLTGYNYHYTYPYSNFDKSCLVCGPNKTSASFLSWDREVYVFLLTWWNTNDKHVIIVAVGNAPTQAHLKNHERPKTVKYKYHAIIKSRQYDRHLDPWYVRDLLRYCKLYPRCTRSSGEWRYCTHQSAVRRANRSSISSARAIFSRVRRSRMCKALLMLYMSQSAVASGAPHWFWQIMSAPRVLT